MYGTYLARDSAALVAEAEIDSLAQAQNNHRLCDIALLKPVDVIVTSLCVNKTTHNDKTCNSFMTTGFYTSIIRFIPNTGITHTVKRRTVSSSELPCNP